MVHDRLDDAALSAVAHRIDRWLAAQKDEHPLVDEAQRVPGDVPRWYVRLSGEQKDAIAIWFTLRERTLHYESYVLPAPEENHAAFYEQLLRRNLKLYGLTFAIGAEDGAYLVGQRSAADVDDDVLDWIVGSMYHTVEQCFRPALRIGFASRMGPPADAEPTA
jgi:hypothetical protein